MTQKTIADEVRAKTDDAKREKDASEQAQREADYASRDKIFASVKANIKETFEIEFLPKIEDAAEKTWSEADLYVGEFAGKARNPTVKTQALLEHGIAYLKQCGFSAKEKFDYSPRAGSDDDYGDRTFVYIHVSW